MYAVSSDGKNVTFISRLGMTRNYTNAQWDKIWPALLKHMFGW